MFTTHKLMGAGGQGGQSYWVALAGNTSVDYGFGVATDSADNIITVGASDSGGTYNGIVIKQNPAGGVIWEVALGASSRNTIFGSVCVDTSDNIIVAGYTLADTPTSTYKIFVAKFNSSGTLQWSKSFYGTLGANGARSVAVDASGNIAVSAYVQKNATYSDAAVLMLNSSGTLQWQRKLVGAYEGDGTGVSFDSSGNVFVVGYYWKQTSGGIRSAFLVKYNSSGTFQWKTGLEITGSNSQFFNGIDIDASGNIYVAGATGPTATYLSQVAKYNSSGTLQWNRRINLLTSGIDVGNSISVSSDGSVYATISANSAAMALAKYNSSGTLQWVRSLYGASTEEVYGVTVDANAIPIFVGYTSSDGAGSFDAVTARVPADGTGTGAVGASLTYASISATDGASPQTVFSPAVTDTALTLTTITSPSVSVQSVTITNELLPLP